MSTSARQHRASVDSARSSSPRHQLNDSERSDDWLTTMCAMLSVTLKHCSIRSIDLRKNSEETERTQNNQTNKHNNDEIRRITLLAAMRDWRVPTRVRQRPSQLSHRSCCCRLSSSSFDGHRDICSLFFFFGRYGCARLDKMRQRTKTSMPFAPNVDRNASSSWSSSLCSLSSSATTTPSSSATLMLPLSVVDGLLLLLMMIGVDEDDDGDDEVVVVLRRRRRFDSSVACAFRNSQMKTTNVNNNNGRATTSYVRRRVDSRTARRRRQRRWHRCARRQ